MWRVVMQVVMIGVLVSQVTVGEDSWRNHGKNKKMFDILCSLFTKAAKGAKGENYIDKLKHARDSSTLKTEVDKVKHLEGEVQSHENNARTAFRKAAYGDNIEKEEAGKTFGFHGGNQPCDPTSGWTTIPRDIVCLCSSVDEATDVCLGNGKAKSYSQGSNEDGLKAWYGVKSRCTKNSASVEVTIEAIRKDLENLRGLYSEDQEVDSPPPPPPPPDSSPLQIPERPDPLASKPWVNRLDEAMGHMNKRDAALEKLREEVKKLKGTYGAAKNEDEVKALKESGAGAEGAQPSRTAPQTAARKDSDAQPTQTQTQKQNIASFPSLKIVLLSVPLCFI